MARSVAGDEPGLQVVVRQQLLDYGVLVGLDVLRQKVSQIQIPDYSKTIKVPVIGDVTVTVRTHAEPMLSSASFLKIK